VKNVSKTCPCTVGELSARELKPSASASLDVVIRAPANEGSIHHTVMVEFENRTDPLFNLAIRGEVRNPVSAVPAAVDFGKVASGTQPTRAIELRNYTDQDLTITKIDAPKGLQVDHKRGESKAAAKRPRQVWTINVQVDPATFKADFRTSALVVYTDSKTLGPVRIPVLYRGQALLTGNPSRLGFGAVELGKTAEKTVLVEASPTLGALTEKDVVCKHSGTTELETKVARTALPGRFLVTLRWCPKRPGKMTGIVEITVPDKTAPAVRIGVSGDAP
jgi:hypothetical protein